MERGQHPGGAVICRAFCSSSTEPSFPLRPSSINSASPPGSPDSTSDWEHPRPFRDSNHGRAVVAHALSSHEATRAGGRLFLSAVGDELQKRVEEKFTPTKSIHPVLALRYKWRTACAKARETDKPDEIFLSAIQHRGIALPAPVKTKSVIPFSSASLSRRSSLPTTPTEATSTPKTSRRGGSAPYLHVARAPRVTRSASVDSPPLSSPPPAAAATRHRSHDHDTRLRTTWRTERNTLMRISEDGREEPCRPHPGARLPGPLPSPRGVSPILQTISPKQMISLTSLPVENNHKPET